MSVRLSYRPEIDGLRAIAVASVIVYHAGLAVGSWRIVPGGYLGVDVFFVISGYLISLIILQSLEAGRFSIRTFYERRARRILPALLVVLAACMPMAWQWMDAAQFVDFGKSVIATLLFSSNVLYWTEDSYTAVPSALKPLLHTWSLGIEEQFYIVFPIFLWCLPQRRSKLIYYAIVPMMLCSFVLAHWLSGRAASASFFLLPTRAWELLLGAVLAKLDIDLGRPRHGVLQRSMPLLGVMFIVIPCFYFDDATRHPGFLTAIPVLGTALVIRFGAEGRDVATRILSSRPFVLLGLASYSVYLWHQPLFAFARLYSVSELSAVSKVLLAGGSIALGVLSWRFIERPFRDRHAVSARGIWIYAATGSLAALALGGLVVAKSGFPDRFPALLAAGKPVPEWWQIKKEGQPCHRNDKLEPCTFEFLPEGRDWVLIGDSHAGVLARTLHDDLRPSVRRFHTFLWGGCPVIFDVTYADKSSANELDCYAANEAKRKFLRALPPSTVVYVARMSAWIEGTRFDNQEGGVEAGTMSQLVPVKSYEGDRRVAVQQLVTATIEEILSMGHRVIVVYPIPEAGWNVPNAVRKFAPQNPVKLKEWINKGGLSTSLDVFTKRSARAYEAYDRVPDRSSLTRVYPAHIFCNSSAGRCYTHSDVDFYYSDDDHLSAAGARLLVDEIMKQAGAFRSSMSPSPAPPEPGER